MGLKDYINEAKQTYDKESLKLLIKTEVELEIRNIAVDLYNQVCKSIAEQLAKGHSSASGILEIHGAFASFGTDGCAPKSSKFKRYPRKLIIEATEELGYEYDNEYAFICKKIMHCDCHTDITTAFFGLQKKYGKSGRVRTFDGWEKYTAELDSLLSDDKIHYSIFVINEEDLKAYHYPLDKSKRLDFNKWYSCETNERYKRSGYPVDFLKPVIEFYYSESN